MRTCTRIFEFDYGHRVLGHGGKCASLHGHRGKAEVTFALARSKLTDGIDDLDNLGMVVDFAEVKKLVGGWIDKNLDHCMILHQDDPVLKLSECQIICGPRPPYAMKRNPTAENLAWEIYKEAQALVLPLALTVYHVRFWETPNCWADYDLEDFLGRPRCDVTGYPLNLSNVK